MDLAELGCGGVDWIGLAQDIYRWRVLVNALLTFVLHKMLEDHRVATQLVAS
jgi:hypothetical protein